MQRKNQRNTAKNFSTATLVLALVCHSAAAAHCQFNEQAPEQHLVKTGDTLWDIASQFLKNPWCWPQVWDTNRDQIRDPRWIYPGQTIYFDRARGQLTLTGKGLVNQNGMLPHRLAPRIRIDSLSPVATARPLALSSLRVQSVLIDDAVLIKAPSISAIKGGRKMAGEHDVIFVKGELGHLTEFMVVRGSERIIDPETQAVLAHAGRRVGMVTLLEAGNLNDFHRFKVTVSDAEMHLGDRLLPATASRDITPHQGVPMNGQLASVLRGSLWASAHDVVAINRGKRHGLNVGSIFSVTKRAKIGAYDPTISLGSIPSEYIASLLVFDANESVALASVMHASDTLSVGDAIDSGRAGRR